VLDCALEPLHSLERLGELLRALALLGSKPQLLVGRLRSLAPVGLGQLG